MSACTSATCAAQAAVVGRLDVEPEQGLGVGRPQVEPPVAPVHGQAVQPVGGPSAPPAASTSAAMSSTAWAGSSTTVLISPESA